MVKVEASYDSIGYQARTTDNFMPPERVFALPDPIRGYTLFRYLYGGTGIRLGIPDCTEPIGTATNERDARKKLKIYLRASEKRESLINQLINSEE